MGMIRNDTMEGRDYLVAPMIMIVEGVHEGSNGPLYYPADELSKTPAVWNHKPIVVYHPQANGEGISACDPIVLTNRKVGIIMNAVVGDVEVDINKKKTKLTALKAEAWLEIDRMKKVDERIATAVEKNEMMELSTGLFTDNEDTEGEWNGEAYTGIARNYRPDHLALLPDLVGACSIEDGAGFLRLNAKPDAIVITNEMSHDNIRSVLNSWLQDKDDDVWVENVYDKFFVFLKDGKYFKGTYSVTDNAVQVSSAFEEIVRVTEWRTKNGNFIGNRKENKMDKEKFVEELIKNENTKWAEDDKDVLMELEEEVLEKMIPVKNETEDDKDKDKKKDDEETSKNEDNKGKETKDEEEEGVENMTAEEYINKKVPSELKGVFQSGLASYKANKSRLIDVITSNEKNIFTKKQLEAKDLDELKALMALAIHTKEQQEHFEVLNYAGQGDPAHNEEEEPMDVPTLNFGDEKK